MITTIITSVVLHPQIQLLISMNNLIGKTLIPILREYIDYTDTEETIRETMQDVTGEHYDNIESYYIPFCIQILCDNVCDHLIMMSEFPMASAITDHEPLTLNS